MIIFNSLFCVCFFLTFEVLFIAKFHGMITNFDIISYVYASEHSINLRIANSIDIKAVEFFIEIAMHYIVRHLQIHLVMN